MTAVGDIPAELVIDRLGMQIAVQAKRIALLEAQLQTLQEQDREDADAEG